MSAILLKITRWTNVDKGITKIRLFSYKNAKRFRADNR